MLFSFASFLYIFADNMYYEKNYYKHKTVIIIEAHNNNEILISN